MIVVQRDVLSVDLRTYGEEDLAERVLTISDDELRRIWERSEHYVYSKEDSRPSGASMLLAKASALAAIEILDGAPRDLHWKRRKLKGIYPGH